MLDQMFTAENFRKIFDRENRKGNDLGKEFFPDVATVSQRIKDKNAELRKLRSRRAKLSPEDFDSDRNDLIQNIRQLKSERSDLVDKELELISQKITSTAYKITLEEKVGPKEKAIYVLEHTPENYLIEKQLQNNIYRLYKVKQSSRHLLTSQIKNTLQKTLPIEIVRTDIASFYESIDRVRLLKKLDEDQLLSSASKKIIKQILRSYEVVSGSEKGLPRGIGVSAYLSELYLRNLDKQINDLPGLLLYCRYVDDIVAIFVRPETGESIGSYLDIVVKVIRDNGLEHNVTKTVEVKTKETTTYAFEYLGYAFKVNAGVLNILPSTTKLNKIETRLNLVFDAYYKSRILHAKKAHRDLVSRIKFLTGNARLINSKANATTGIYFNNSLVTDPSVFDDLDAKLSAMVAGTRRKILKNALKKFKFKQGFIERRFHNFSSQELKNIVKPWKHV